jgi:hypothetical protein
MCVTTREILLKLRLMHCNHIIAEVEKMAWARRRDARVAAPFKWCIQLWGSRRSIIRSSSYSSSIYPCRRGTKMICQVWSRFSKYNFRMRFGLDPQDAGHQQTNGHRGFFFFLSRNSTYVQSNWLVVSGLIYQLCIHTVAAVSRLWNKKSEEILQQNADFKQQNCRCKLNEVVC